MSAHTPGPWTYERKGGKRYIRDANGSAIFCDEPYYPWCSDNEADWPLVAAAPALVSALEDAVHRVRWLMQFVPDTDPIEEELARWDAALRLARGEDGEATP